MKAIEKHLKTYKETSDQISDLEKKKSEAKAEIMKALNEQGLSSVEAGGFRASLSYRDQFGFNDLSEDGSEMASAAVARRLEKLHEAFAEHLPSLDIPASTNIAKLADVMMSKDGAVDFDAWTSRPAFLKSSKTTILRVSGGAS